VREFLISLSSGVGTGAIYSLIALGYSFIFRTTGTFNFAQGNLATIGSLLAYSMYTKGGWPVLAAVVAAVLAVGLLGGFIERIAIFPLIRRNDEPVTWLISTLGIAVILTAAAERIWGTIPLPVANYIGPAFVHIDGIGIQTPYFYAIGVALLVTVGIEAMQRVSVWGRVMKAMGENRNAVELAGVNVFRAGFLAFIVGSGLAGLAGFLIVPVTYADPTAGFQVVIMAFVALAIGGFANHWGALLGGLMVGVIESLAGTYIGFSYGDVYVFLFLIVVLLVKPEGLFSRHSGRLA
jgi:branched-chain amino acid transport system permease protein